MQSRKHQRLDNRTLWELFFELPESKKPDQFLTGLNVVVEKVFLILRSWLISVGLAFYCYPEIIGILLK